MTAKPIASQSVDVLIVGAGPAGAIAALLLARRGFAVRLVDRATFPRWKVCGCCLNARAVASLESIGLGHLLRDAGAVPLNELVWAIGERSVRLPLGGGRAISRERFDDGIIAAAQSAGATFQPETRVEAGESSESFRRVWLHSPHGIESIDAKIVIAADGLSSQWLPVTIAAGTRIGAGTTLPDSDPFYTPGHIWMATHRQGYVGLTQLEDGRLDVAAAWDRAALRELGGPGPAAATVLESVGWPIPRGWESAAWRGTPGLTRHARELGQSRLFGVGDAVGYVEPFTGEGMSWAIAGAIALAPIVASAVEHWHPDSILQWSRKYHRHVGSHQQLCRWVAGLMRRPRWVHWTIAGLQQIPAIANPVIRRLHTARPMLRSSRPNKDRSA
ncbi:NAD(P)/FAD-dependent oxidoreductase [Tuwongella immobilis]|uniref:FAD-binding domain-containing protein n=1 Tax=Tuwongella immobilis TaxID=692036 RepID=A0A6C2YWT7_9BACT|nr:FAD-dependent monooxygenase [Tuwongella immobilis]VIP05613.1 nad binding site : Uncharacterized protein OS=Synechococcus sp. BL107 GN=BL107_12066 PE=4 SV=1: FAD_binding_3 [Tuwongella immobilis]VTS08582.1 nad binding site : Uncharacterized protein OS=Synechococcus sp. BL107 GN=BL107_12066 PE=4 SV=1: FAD_binding_3 [Tuwongella immobilis]